MLDYALAILFMSGVWSLGYGLTWLLGLRGSHRIALAYPVGLSGVGLSAWSLWLAEIPWIYIWTLGWLVGLLSLSLVIFNLIDTPPSFKNWQFAWPSFNLFTSLMLWVSLFSLAIILVWLTFIQPVVWDSLVLYDWRAIKIADGWLISDFYQQFTRHYEFYMYDFSHPFMSSIWQAFLHRSGIENTGIIYTGLIISILIYAGTIWRSWTSRLIFATLLLATEPMLTVFTQVYSALPYFLYWLLIFLTWVDPDIKSHGRKTALVIIFLVTLLMNRFSEPFWILFLVFWIWEMWQRRSGEKLIYTLAKIGLFITPIWAIYWEWLGIQVVAFSHVEIIDSLFKSSYSLDTYASLSTVLQTPLWWSQAVWLLIFMNPSLPYVLLALGMFVFISWQNKLSNLDGQDKRLLWLGLGWLAMLIAALIMEISTDPDNWLLKSRLLWRVTLPIMAWAMVVSVNWSSKLEA